MTTDTHHTTDTNSVATHTDPAVRAVLAVAERHHRAAPRGETA